MLWCVGVCVASIAYGCNVKSIVQELVQIRLDGINSFITHSGVER